MKVSTQQKKEILEKELKELYALRRKGDLLKRKSEEFLEKVKDINDIEEVLSEL